MTSMVRRDSMNREWPARWRAWLSSGMPELFRDWDLDELFERDGMRLEEHRDGDTLVVRAEMPGIDPEKDVEISISDNTLHLSAERKETVEEEDAEKGSYRSEFRYGRFSRRVPLPAGTSEDDVKATYNDGILEVRIPVRDQEPERRTIPVNRA